MKALIGIGLCAALLGNLRRAAGAGRPTGVFAAARPGAGTADEHGPRHDPRGPPACGPGQPGKHAAGVARRARGKGADPAPDRRPAGQGRVPGPAGNLQGTRGAPRPRPARPAQWRQRPGGPRAARGGAPAADREPLPQRPGGRPAQARRPCRRALRIHHCAGVAAGWQAAGDQPARPAVPARRPGRCAAPDRAFAAGCQDIRAAERGRAAGVPYRHPARRRQATTRWRNCRRRRICIPRWPTRRPEPAPER